MPTYIYRALDKGTEVCEYCKEGFEINQNIADKPSEKCPKCGAVVKKVPTIFSFQMKP